MSERIGPKQREMLDILSEPGGELWNDGGMWSAKCNDEEGTRYSGRVPAQPCQRLFERGFIYCVRIDQQAGEYGADRAVYVLTEKGKRA